jgi:hypothetical protein
MKISYILFIVLIFGLVNPFSSLVKAEERDPFLSPFEPRKIVPKKPDEENPIVKTNPKEEKPPSALDEVKIKEIKKLLNTNQSDKAEPILIEYKKALGEKELSEADKAIIADLEDQISNYNKYKEMLKAARALMTVQGKIILNDKKNILLINNQPVAEGEDITDLLKLESTVILSQVKEETFSLQYKDIIVTFHIE